MPARSRRTVMAGLDPATHAGDARSVWLYPALLGCVRVTGVRGLFGGNGVGGRVKPGHDVRFVAHGSAVTRVRSMSGAEMVECPHVPTYVMAGLDPATHAGDARSMVLYPALLGCVRVTGVRGRFDSNGVGGRVEPGHDVHFVAHGSAVTGAVDERSGDGQMPARPKRTSWPGLTRPPTPGMPLGGAISRAARLRSRDRRAGPVWRQRRGWPGQARP